MSDWLRSLPHQIPFRATSSGRLIDDTTAEGEMLVSVGDPLPLRVMLVEALAQLGGAIAFRVSGQRGMLTGMDGFHLSGVVQEGDLVRLRVKLEHSFGLLHRLTGTGEVNGEERVRARFYLALDEHAS